MSCATARDRLARAVDTCTPVVVTDLAVAEAYHALHYHYGVPKPEARELLRRFVASGVVHPEPADLARVLGDSADSPAGLVDHLIHARHRADRATTLTFDTRQAALEGAELCGGGSARG